MGKKIDEFLMPVFFEISTPFFKSFNFIEGFEMIRNLNYIIYQKDEIVLKPSQTSVGVYIIIEGVVAVCHKNHEDFILTYLEKGSYFGEKFVINESSNNIKEYSYKVITPYVIL